MYTLLSTTPRKSVLKINGIELINHGIICQIIEKSIKLNFEKCISNICKKASNQLNAICTLQTFMGHKEKEAMINTFAHSNFNYRPVFVFGTSVLKSSKINSKVEKIYERSLKFLTSLHCEVIPERKQASPLLEIFQNCLTPLGNSKVKNQDPWKFHMGFS